MQFNSSIKSISITGKSRIIFEELVKVKPHNMSFSAFLAYVSGEYLKDIQTVNQIEGNLPTLLGDIFQWSEHINMCELDELKNIQQRLLKLQNLIDNRMDRILC